MYVCFKFNAISYKIEGDILWRNYIPQTLDYYIKYPDQRRNFLINFKQFFKVMESHTYLDKYNRMILLINTNTTKTTDKYY